MVYSFWSRANCADGDLPSSGLLDVNGTLYGTTTSGSDYGYCAVFSLDPQTGVETVLYSFAGGIDGADPDVTPIDVNGTLYGTTPNGGTYGDGTEYALELNS